MKLIENQLFVLLHFVTREPLTVKTGAPLRAAICGRVPLHPETARTFTKQPKEKNPLMIVITANWTRKELAENCSNKEKVNLRFFCCANADDEFIFVGSVKSKCEEMIERDFICKFSI